MGCTACTEPQCLYSRAIPLPPPLWAVWPVRSLSACTRVHFTFLIHCRHRGRVLEGCHNPGSHQTGHRATCFHLQPLSRQTHRHHSTHTQVSCQQLPVQYSLNQCFSTAGPRPGTGPWHQLYRAVRFSWN